MTAQLARESHGPTRNVSATDVPKELFVTPENFGKVGPETFKPSGGKS